MVEDPNRHHPLFGALSGPFIRMQIVNVIRNDIDLQLPPEHVVPVRSVTLFPGLMAISNQVRSLVIGQIHDSP